MLPTAQVGLASEARSTGQTLAKSEGRRRERGRWRWVLALCVDMQMKPGWDVYLACVPEDGEEVAGGSGGDKQMPDEMAITELLGQVESDPAGVSESAGGQPE